MKSQTENTSSGRLTIFKPPGYIYKLSKTQSKSSQKLEYEAYYNAEYSLRKYNRTINIANQSQLLLYEWRKQSSSPIVNVAYLQLINRTISSSASEQGAIEVNVYTEHIEKSLADMINLTLSESIYVLKECLLAYQELFNKFSAVSINKFYSGLNAQGKLKVWINDNLAVNNNVQRSSDSQYPLNDILIVQPAIVNKIIHMVSLLANTSCKYFFYGMEKQLTIKRFTFNNCLQYINTFVTKTKNLEIPTTLAYMLPKRNPVGLDRSAVKFLGNTRMKTFNDQRKENYFSGLNNTNSFKQVGSYVKLNNRQSIGNDSENQNTPNQTNQNKFRFKRHSEQVPKNFITSLFPSKGQNKPDAGENTDQNKKQCKISLHMIIEKNNRRNSIKSNDVLVVRKSNISVQKQRPSICIVPQFISKSSRGEKVKEELNAILNPKKETQKSINSKSNKSQKSYSLQSSKSKSKDYNSLVNSKIGSSYVRKFGTSNKEDHMYRTHKPQRIQRNQTELSSTYIHKSGQSSNIRSRSVSANIKFGSYEFKDKFRAIIQQHEQKNAVQASKSHRGSFCNKSKAEGDKTSTNSISNEGTAKKRSFLTKTNYDSNTDDNQKNQSFCRMDFSSMSIENRITNKNFDSQVTTSRKEEMKRSLMSFKFGFEQILENPSCKEVEQENQTKSYNGSSLRNTQNISDQINWITNNNNNKKKNEDTTSNNFSFGNNSNKLSKRQMRDSIQENWDLIKQKNEEVLTKNQWKKTINNLGELENMAVNESIVDTSREIVKRDRFPDVRLEKLERLGKNMCFSIVNRTEEGCYSLNSSIKKSNVVM